MNIMTILEKMELGKINIKDHSGKSNERSEQSNFRATGHFQDWLSKNRLIGIYGVDTRKITQILREKGAINAIISYKKNGRFNFKNIAKELKNWEGIKGRDLTKIVTRNKIFSWNKNVWSQKPILGKRASCNRAINRSRYHRWSKTRKTW